MGCMESTCKNIAIANQKYCIDYIYCINCSNYRNDDSILCEQCEGEFYDNKYDEDDSNCEYNKNNNKVISCCAPFCDKLIFDTDKYCSNHKSCVHCDNDRLENNIFCIRCLFI